jgi:ligand-binding sensor domain-containing protein
MSISATATTRPGLHPGWTTYTTADGLADNYVSSIAVGRDGVLWFGIAGGVTRYDGETWATVTSVDDPLTRSFHVPLVVAPDGAVWYSNWSAGGVYRLEGESLTFHTTDDILMGKEVLAITTAPGGALWFGTRHCCISRFSGLPGSTDDDKTWTTYTGSEDDWSGDPVGAIAVGQNGVLWFGTWGGGAFRFDGENWTNYTWEDGLGSNSVLCITAAPDGALWFGTERGASRFDGQTWTTYTPDDGLADYTVSSITVGPDGTLWLGTRNGVSRYNGQTWVTFTTEDGLADNSVSSIAVAPDGALWFGTLNGVSRFLPQD